MIDYDALLEELDSDIEEQGNRQKSEAALMLLDPELIEVIRGLKGRGRSNTAIAKVLNNKYKDTFASYETKTPAKFFKDKNKPEGAKVKGDEVVYMTKPSFTDRMILIALETPEEKTERKRVEKMKRDKKKNKFS